MARDDNPGGGRATRPGARPRGVRHRGPLSLLTLRILALNILALGILVAGLLFLGDYRDGLIDAKIEATTTLAAMIAGAIGEGATGPPDFAALDAETARQMVRRMAEPTATRALLFDTTGALLADSRRLRDGGRVVEQRPLAPPADMMWVTRRVVAIYDWVVGHSPWRPDLPAYHESTTPDAGEFPEVLEALEGRTGYRPRLADEVVILSIAVPVQGFKRVVGALLVQTDTGGIEASVRAVRLAILRVFAAVLALTVLLSIYLAGTIARPIRRLAEAAERVQRGKRQRVAIPDFTGRRDEIGDLSAALREMTTDLYERLDAIEAFAADVAHELKNPLTSLRSALESIETIDDDERRRELLALLKDDIGRIDRLISDISQASRLDAELSRAEFSIVNVGDLLETLVAVHRTATGESEHDIDLKLEMVDRDHLLVEGIDDRLGQIAQNLLDNAVSFSPPGGAIVIRAALADGRVRFSVEDQGRGVPEPRAERIFERFYTDRRPGDRPDGGRFGQHSGLGLSICLRIAEAHGGAITAENRRDADGGILGARFIVDLPAADTAARR